MRTNVGFCPNCGALRRFVGSKWFKCGSWDELNPQDGWSMRYTSEYCRIARGQKVYLQP